MKRMIPIWFFIGCLLSIYGTLILAAGIRNFSSGAVSGIAMRGLHLQLWWGGALLILGLVYVIRFWPREIRISQSLPPSETVAAPND
jgi:integral membrane sensor domain MASE1